MTVAHASASRLELGLLACLMVGLPVGLDVELVGRITGSELALLVLLPVAVVMGRLPPLTWPIRTLVILAFVWLGAQFASDMVNDTTPDNMVRGAARALATVALILGFFTLIGDRLRNARILFLVLGAGLIIGPYFQPSVFFEGDAWKFGYGGGVTMLMIGAASILWIMRQRSMAIAVCLGAGVLNLYLGYRSMAGTAFLSGLLLVLPMIFEGRAHAFSTLRIALMLLVMLVGGTGLIEIYSRAAESGVLGFEAQEKYLEQVDERGVLLSGRAELPVSLEAVSEKPLLGHGSWAVNEYYATMYWEMSGLNADYVPIEAVDLIPTHSHLMGAWVEGGVFAALFWFYVITMLVRGIVATMRNTDLADPIITFTLVNLAWSIMFSPYGLTNRVLSCFAIIVVATVLRLDARNRGAAAAPARGAARP